MKWMLVPRGERIVYYLQRGAVGAMHAYGCKLEPYTSMGSLPSHAAVFADQLLRLHPVACDKEGLWLGYRISDSANN